jgi:hypothetical protein
VIRSIELSDLWSDPSRPSSSLSDPPLSFTLLHARALRALQHKIHNGEFSERTLARLARVSQPHVHHLLCQKRRGRLEVIDQLLRSARISFTDLID